MAGRVMLRPEWSTVNANFSALSGPMPEAVQHHTGGSGPSIDLVAWLRGLEAGEMSRGDGLIALAYHWMVISGGPHDGTKIECRPWWVQGGATLNHNSSSRAVCMSGNFENEHPTDNALDSCAEVWADGIRGGFVSRAVTIQPHQLYFPTACPGRNLIAALPDLRGRVSAKVSGVTPVPPKPKVRLAMFYLRNPDGGWWVAHSDGRVDFLRADSNDVFHGGMTTTKDRTAFGDRKVKSLTLRRYIHQGKRKYGYTITATDGATYVPEGQR